MAVNQNHARIMKELSEMRRSPDENISAGPLNDDNLNQWEATLFGPKDTPYEGGMFRIKIDLPVNYPFSPPKLTFKTFIYHCNIKDGEICLDILKNQWSPALTLSKVLLSISSLLSDPNPDDPLDAKAANLYKSNIEEYNRLARQYTLKHATVEDFD